jgi:hypothetical protein
VLFLSNTKQGHLAFTMGLEDYTYQQCALNVRYLRNRLAQQKCPPTLEINAVKMLLLRGQVGRRRKTSFSKSRSFNATQFNSYSNLASALKVKGAVKNG